MSTGTRRTDWACLVVIMLVACLLRLYVALHNPIPAGDGIASNMEMAVHLSRGDGFSTLRKWNLYDPSMDPLRPEANRQPAVSVMLLLFPGLTGDLEYSRVQLLMIAWGLLLILLSWLYLRRLFGSLPALLTAGFLSLEPLFLWYSVHPDSLVPYTCLVLTACLVVDLRPRGDAVSAALLGLLAGVAYLFRTQGMLLAVSVLAYLLIKRDVIMKRRLARTAVFAVVFLLVISPWLLRNLSAFGSPTYSQNSQFLLNENHWAAWEVRTSAPSPTDIIKYGGIGSLLHHLLAGVARVAEPFLSGTMHRGGPFAASPLAAFVALGAVFLAGAGRRLLGRLVFPLVVSVPVIAILVLHDHPHRYLSFPILMVAALGFAGIVDMVRARSLSRSVWGWVLPALMFLPLYRPVGNLLSSDARDRAAEAAEVSAWIAGNTSPEDRVVTFPNVELLIWEYLRPTLTMPNDYECLLWQCLEDHGVTHLIVDPDLPALRPRLASRWRFAADGSGWEIADPPPFLQPVYTSTTGRTIVYRWSGEVPEGFMAVDSLPRDNLRALPPAGAVGDRWVR